MVRYRERMKGEFGVKKGSSIGVCIKTFHCTCKRQNLLVLLLPAGAQRKILLDMIYTTVEGMGEEGVSTVYIL